jgi:hypothetical protein
VISIFLLHRLARPAPRVLDAVGGQPEHRRIRRRVIDREQHGVVPPRVRDLRVTLLAPWTSDSERGTRWSALRRAEEFGVLATRRAREMR